jgi:hypothetical protein
MTGGGFDSLRLYPLNESCTNLNPNWEFKTVFLPEIGKIIENFTSIEECSRIRWKKYPKFSSGERCEKKHYNGAILSNLWYYMCEFQSFQKVKKVSPDLEKSTLNGGQVMIIISNTTI